MNATTTITKPNKQLQALLNGPEFIAALKSALPKHMKPERFIRISANAIMKTPKLSQCDMASFFWCLLQLSSAGLEPDGRQAHLIPFWNSKRNTFECQLIIGYQGLIDLATRNPDITAIHADIVCEGDSFSQENGVVSHKRAPLGKPRGKRLGAYAIAIFSNGAQKSEVMDFEQIETIRNRSKDPDSFGWKDNWDEMAKKTVARRLCKWLPRCPELQDAIELEENQESQSGVSILQEKTDPAIEALTKSLDHIQPDSEAKIETLTEQEKLEVFLSDYHVSLEQVCDWCRQNNLLQPDEPAWQKWSEIPTGICQKLAEAKQMAALLKSLGKV